MRSWLILPLLLAGTSARAADEVPLFNGNDFTGWTFFLEEKDYNAGGKGKISDFAVIKPGGVIEINPKLHGALMTERDYLNYKLHAEWRWVDPEARNNSGLFLRIRVPYVWDMEHGEQARMYMVQLQPPNSGDLWVLGYAGSQLRTDPARSYKPYGELEVGPGVMGAASMSRHLRSVDAEKPVGEWNAADVEIVGKTIKVWINGQLVNEGTSLVDLPGRIGLESEFGPIQFRNIRLTPIADDAPPLQTSVPPAPSWRGRGGGAAARSPSPADPAPARDN
jgi:hypothetical protein